MLNQPPNDRSIKCPESASSLNVSAKQTLTHLAKMTVALNGQIIDWNDGCERLYGWSAPEALGQNIDRLLHTRFSTQETEIKKQLFTEGYWQGVLFQCKRDSKKFTESSDRQHTGQSTSNQVTSELRDRLDNIPIVTVASHWTVQQDSQGEPLAYLIINIDISDVSLDLDRSITKSNRRSVIFKNNKPPLKEFSTQQPSLDVSVYRLSQALSKPEQFLNHCISNIPGAIYRCTIQQSRTLEFISDPIFNILGYSPNELIDNSTYHYYSLIIADDRNQVQETLDGLTPENPSFSLDYRLMATDRTIKWVHDRGRGIFSKSGTLLYIDGVIFEISKRKKAEEMLAKSHERITHVLESIPDGFFVLDRKDRFAYINTSAAKMLHRDRESLIKKSIWKEFPKLVKSIGPQCHQAVTEKKQIQFEVFEPFLGSWLDVIANPYPVGLSVYFQDITVRKQTEIILSERSHLSAFSAEMGLTLGQTGILVNLLQHCVDALVEHLEINSANIWIFNSATNLLELRAKAGNPLDEKTFPKRCVPGESIIGNIGQNGQQITGNLSKLDGKLEELFPDSCLLQANLAGYPLIVEERLAGVMIVCSGTPLTDSIQSTLGLVANAIAIAIDRAWVREALLSRREGLLFRLASEIRNSLDLDTILETAVNEIRTVLRIDRCHFLWYFHNPIQPCLTVTHESQVPDLPSLLRDYSPEKSQSLAQKITNLEALRVDEISTDRELAEDTRSLMSDMGMTSVLLLPLETRSGQLGAVVCSHSRGARPWSDSEVELLQAVVDQVALGIDQAELYAQTHASALAAQTQAKQLTNALHNLQQTQSQLIQTEKMSSLGQMVAGIAHEINNPVNFITGNLVHTKNYVLDLLGLTKLYQHYYPDPVPEIQEEADSIDLDFLMEDLPKILKSMEIGADRISQIVLSLRNFSRLDEAEMKPVNIHDGIDSTLLILQNRCKPKGKNAGIQIIKHYGNLPKVECYAGQLNQVFMNILANAMDALESQPNPHIITITTEEIAPEEGMKPSVVAIRIRDNGSGMTEEVTKRLFDPFFTTKPVGKGTGLGMSISYKIVVEKHRGTIECFSEMNRGTEFAIQIPIYQSKITKR